MFRAWNTESGVFGVDLRYGGSEEQHREDSIHGKTSSAISGHPDVPCFLLLDDPANELFLLLTLAHLTIGLFAKGPIVQRRFYAYGLRCWVDKARILS
jgi:hypothetical protein